MFLVAGEEIDGGRGGVSSKNSNPRCFEAERVARLSGVEAEHINWTHRRASYKKPRHDLTPKTARKLHCCNHRWEKYFFKKRELPGLC
jgi:hypothetical protein